MRISCAPSALEVANKFKAIGTGRWLVNTSSFGFTLDEHQTHYDLAAVHYSDIRAFSNFGLVLHGFTEHAKQTPVAVQCAFFCHCGSEKLDALALATTEKRICDECRVYHHVRADGHVLTFPVATESNEYASATRTLMWNDVFMYVEAVRLATFPRELLKHPDLAIPLAEYLFAGTSIGEFL